MEYFKILAAPTLMIIGGIITWLIKSKTEELKSVHVITSYSIHYTKLYDQSILQEQGVCNFTTLDEIEEFVKTFETKKAEISVNTTRKVEQEINNLESESYNFV